MLIDKPSGWTSHDAVAVVRRRLGQRSVGHTGTLDPFATGLLVICIGRATRLARFIEAAHKSYEAVVRFGTATDTEDGTGTVISHARPASWPDRPLIEVTLAGFVGTGLQRPPVFSAKHVAGVRSHSLARAGASVEFAPVEVVIMSLECVSWDPPDLTLRATVGKGTYLRALARDIGERIGIPAHCAELRRTAVGPFLVTDATRPEDVTPAEVREPARMVTHLPSVTLDGIQARDVGFGRTVPRIHSETGPVALLGEDGHLVGIAEARDEVWQPVVVMEPS